MAAPKHGEVLIRQPGGWTVAWDANTAVEPALRKAFDKVIEGSTQALRDIVRDTDSGSAMPAAPAQRAARRPRAAS